MGSRKRMCSTDRSACSERAFASLRALSTCRVLLFERHCRKLSFCMLNCYSISRCAAANLNHVAPEPLSNQHSSPAAKRSLGW